MTEPEPLFIPCEGSRSEPVESHLLLGVRCWTCARWFPPVDGRLPDHHRVDTSDLERALGDG